MHASHEQLYTSLQRQPRSDEASQPTAPAVAGSIAFPERWYFSQPQATQPIIAEETRLRQSIAVTLTLTSACPKWLHGRGWAACTVIYWLRRTEVRSFGRNISSHRQQDLFQRTEC